jgi:uncharacterized protein DUF4160
MTRTPFARSSCGPRAVGLVPVGPMLQRRCEPPNYRMNSAAGGGLAGVGGRCHVHRCQNSLFFGIIIRMFVETGVQHRRAHFHAFYPEHAAVFAINAIECVNGSLPKPPQRRKNLPHPVSPRA